MAVVGTLVASVSATMLIDSPRPEPAATVAQGGALVGAIPAVATRPAPYPAAPPPVTDLGRTMSGPPVSSQRGLAESSSAGSDSDADTSSRQDSAPTDGDDRSGRRPSEAVTDTQSAPSAQDQARERAREQARQQVREQARQQAREQMREWARQWARDHQSRQQTQTGAGDSTGRGHR